ncbi:hypothetical protein INT43_005468 [Umbelopsis isabellina]|uniref:GPI ethanolamine phosphate transferase 2 n=1 Tax=Mortierella isabellina TaxID=91625 RepID=A0A8H7PLA2_MORIS|nr:hypothetical protein INT43_005468 [Umbelopsis isabellina]
MLTSVLVVIYKVRSENSLDSVPVVYQDLTTWDLADRLNQIQLGRLIFNYGAASFFMLNVSIFIGKFVRKLDITDKRIAVSPKPYALLLLRVATPLLVLLSRTHNAILFSVFELQLQLLHLWFCSDTEAPSATDSVASILPKPVAATSILLALTQCTFFLMGNSNSLSSVDLGNAYIGVDDYNIGFTGLLTFVSNWSGSIWWTIAGISIIVDGYWQCYKPVESVVMHSHSTAVTSGDDHDDHEDETLETTAAEGSKSAISSDLLSYYSMYYICSAFFFSVALSTLTISVTILRQHLFIWTVFSPKFLFQGAWITLYHCVIQTLISTFLVVVWVPWCIT